uniref:ALG8 alpha-1,3-glucosyltransferase n=1 Tax=Oryctolagus cuniculus TaxID=9986 RepID=A0A5F9CPV4_RABIT
MMSGRPGREPLKFLPDEARSLPPPKLTDPRLLYFGFMGYCSGLLDNALRRRPVTMADKKTYGEILEEFHPVH